MLIYINRSSHNIELITPSNYKQIYNLNNSTKDELTSHGALVLKK